MSDLPALMKVIDKMDRIRLGYPDVVPSDLKRRALDFYASQGVEVDASALESVCGAVTSERPLLPPYPASLAMNMSEKRWRVALLCTGASVLAAGLVLSLAGLEYWSLIAAAVAPMVGAALLFIGMEMPAFRRSLRRDDAYVALLKSASVTDLLLLRRNPMLSQKWALEVDNELYSRGLSSSGQSILECT